MKMILSTVKKGLKGRYVITATYSNRGYYRGDVIRRDGLRVSKCVHDDYSGYGYSLDECISIIDAWYQNDVNLSFENGEQIRNLEQEICKEKGIEYGGSLPDWFKGDGYYSGYELIMKAGETTYYDNGDVYYMAELADDIEIEVDDYTD